MSWALPLWVRLHALGARDATLDAAVRASDLAELWESARADVALDVARLAGLDLDEVVRALRGVLVEPIHEGARRWADAALDALSSGPAFVAAASFAFDRCLDALELLFDPQLARSVRGALDVDDVAAALALGTYARQRPTAEDDLAAIVGGYDRPCLASAERSAQ